MISEDQYLKIKDFQINDLLCWLKENNFTINDVKNVWKELNINKYQRKINGTFCICCGES